MIPNLDHLVERCDQTLEELEKKQKLAGRGKSAEGAVRSLLTELAGGSVDFAFERLPDVRAGARTESICDFFCTHKGRSILIEVKEVEHGYRLPHKNFDKDSVARMRRFKLAGANAFVVVRFKPLKLWRGADIDYFRTRTGGSWDMRDIEPKPLTHWISL